MNPTRRARVRAVVALAADVIGAAWPLDTFVAVNPLAGFETTTFAEATARASVLFRARVLPGATSSPPDPSLDDGGLRANELIASIGDSSTLGDVCAELGWGDVVARIDERVSRWLSAYCDRGEATWHMPHREAGFYLAWKRLARHENALAPSARAYRAAVDALPVRADDALAENLDALAIPEQRWIGYLERHLAQCAGWSSYIKHLVSKRDAGLDLVALLAVRTWYERQEIAAAAGAHGVSGTYDAVCSWVRENADRIPPATGSHFDRVTHDAALERLEAREGAFREDVLGRIRHAPARSPARVDAQLVFCIDARSEPLRRHLESVGPYETFGFAGFFGVPVRYRPYGSAHTLAQAPVLVRPRLTIDEHPSDAAAKTLLRRGTRASTRAALAGGALYHPVAAFAGVELFGLFSLLRAARDTFIARRRPDDRAVQPLDLDAIAVDERVFLAESTLRIMGLTRDFAPLVVMCGHGGATVNNAFRASLDCGACGGNRGLVNARVLCAMLNDPEVRAGLIVRGITIPAQTFFVAAEHDTTRDLVHFVWEDAPIEHQAGLRDLERAITAAAVRRRQDRAAELPPSPLGLGDASARAADWAQVRPEWGLARNAGMIIAPRSLTRDVDLEGRCFLHSYDPDADVGGVALEQILTAPLIVAQWINLQYFFATVDPERFGSGDKVLQQVVGGFGVVVGNGGDLRLGLPLQSTTVGSVPYHEPLRLQVFVYAPTARIDAVIARQTVLGRIFDNHWVTLVAIDPDTGRTQRYAGHHTWLPMHSTEVASCSQIA
jgi:uncharacterized protein YbcC (UPF0753/DUF2309 family)